MSGCSCGCCGLESNPGCIYSASGRTSTERRCSAEGVGDVATLQQIWQENDCVSTYSNILFTSPNDLLQYNPKNLARIQADFNNLLRAYISYGFNFTEQVNSPLYNSMQYTLVDACADYRLPGACDLFLRPYCSQLTRDQISSDGVIASLCGCYSPPLYPSTVSPECDSMCHLTTTVQLSDPCSGEIARCSNTVCVIDDVNINLVDTEATAAFTQICPACDQEGKDPCVCIIGGVDPAETITNAGVSTTYTQYCGENSICYQTDQYGGVTQVPCPTADAGQPAPSYQTPLALFIIAVAFVVLTVVVMLAIREGKRK